MAGGIVTMSFEEKMDSMVTANHGSIVAERMRASLMSTGKKWDGIELDGELFTKEERVIIGTHKGPMLAKFKSPNPTLEVRSEIKKTAGHGKNSLNGKRAVKIGWFEEGCKIYIDPRSGRGGQETVGWSNLGVDYGKSGSIFSVLGEWLPQMGLSEVDPITMSGLLDAMSGKENYTMMFIKAVLILRTISVGFSVEGIEWQAVEELPTCVYGDKRVKISQVGQSECMIDLDALTDTESLVAMLSSMEYPSVQCVHDGKTSIYGQLSLPECDTIFVSSQKKRITEEIPPPEKWWKALVGLAAKLGAVENLLTAFRVTRGLASWSHGLKKLGMDEFDMTLGVYATRGCRSLLIDSSLCKVDKVTAPSNMASSLGELLCDWACGQEMINMLFHVSDEFGLANKDINRNVTGLGGCSVGDSLLREAGFYDYGMENMFYNEACSRFGLRVSHLGNEHLKALIQNVGSMMVRACGQGVNNERDHLKTVKNLAFTNYYGRLWQHNATVCCGGEGSIYSTTWGATTKKKSDVYNLRLWLDLHGLSDFNMLHCGYNATQRAGLETINHTSMGKVEGAHGVYEEVYREVNWKDNYTPRIGSETMEKDRLDFVKTYLGMVDDDTVVIEKEIPKTVELIEGVPKESFRGTLGLEKLHEEGQAVGKEKEKEADITHIPKQNTRVRKAVVHAGKRLKETFTTMGINGFTRDITANGTKFRVRKAIGNGMCVANAIAGGMRELSIPVTDSEMIEFMKMENEEQDWFEVEKASVLMQKLGLGVAIYDVRTKHMYGVGTTNRPANEIVGITYDGSHCETLSRVMPYDRLIDQGELVTEIEPESMNEIMLGIFSGSPRRS